MNKILKQYHASPVLLGRDSFKILGVKIATIDVYSNGKTKIVTRKQMKKEALEAEKAAIRTEAMTAGSKQGAEIVIAAAQEVDPELMAKVATVGNEAVKKIRTEQVKIETSEKKIDIAQKSLSAAEILGYKRQA